MANNEERNALAKLAKELSDFQEYLHDEFKVGDRGLEKAQDIVAELAKVNDYIHRAGTTLMYTPEERIAVIAAVERCRRIAEEGVEE